MHERIEIRTADGVVRVAPSGDVDMVTAPALRVALEEAAARRPARIVVSLRDVTFLDSTGLGAIVHGLRTAADQGVALTLSEASPAIRRVLAVTGLDDLLDGDDHGAADGDG